MGFNLHELQAECNDWQNYNFPHTPASDVLHGVSEEFGELCHAIHIGRMSEQIDAIGDIGIFAINFANKMSIDITDVVMAYGDAYFEGQPRPYYPYPSLFILGVEIGRLCHAFLKARQGIRGANERQIEQAFANFWVQLGSSAMVICNKPLDTILEDTWNIVRQRNWRDHPEHGGKGT